ncbi:hypothetical protein DH09_00555 (plasmid) [Bacillaceae bacterium JMAK1]|nr:hypothetical protein DH09_00555 [Bacillaceae bacterium JMAK1]
MSTQTSQVGLIKQKWVLGVSAMVVAIVFMAIMTTQTGYASIRVEGNVNALNDAARGWGGTILNTLQIFFGVFAVALTAYLGFIFFSSQSSKRLSDMKGWIAAALFAFAFAFQGHTIVNFLVGVFS